MVAHQQEPVASYTDCRSEEGLTVGLIDTIITVCHVLVRRGLYGDAVSEALKDLHSDEDVRKVVFCCADTSPDDARMERLHERVVLIRKSNRSPEQVARLRELDKFVADLPTSRSPGEMSFVELMMDFARTIPSGASRNDSELR